MKERINAITAMRGMGVLGVVGIHVGSIYIENPSHNLFLVALYEEASRYAVPIFFFLSAFGLFYKLDLNKKYDYFSMLNRRLKTVLLPYIVWSLFYLWHTSFCYNTPIPFDKLTEILFFGLAKYHIYFLVILIWFYLLMPLWIFIVKNLNKRRLFIIFILQIAVNYYFCYSGDLYRFQMSLEEGSLFRLALMHRLNYWVIFYSFIFLFGAYWAQRFDEFKIFLKERKNSLTIFFILALVFQICHFFALIKMGRTALEAVYTAHQLSPLGVIYTLTSCLFFFWLFTYKITKGKLFDGVTFIGKHSYFIYLAHPIFLTVTTLNFSLKGVVTTAEISLLVYAFALFASLFFAIIFQKIADMVPILGLLILGKRQ